MRKRRKAKATMGIEPHPCGSTQPQQRQRRGRPATADPVIGSKTMTVPRRRPGLPKQPRQLDAGPLEPLIGSFALHLAAEGEAARTVQGYTSAVRWFAAGYLAGQPGKASSEQVDAQDIQRWTAKLLGPVQRRLRQHPVPGAAAVLQVAGVEPCACRKSHPPR